MYLKQIYLSKTTAAGCLFKKNSKKTKKKLKPKSPKTTAVLLYDFFPIIRIFFFVNEQNCLLHSLNFIFFVKYLFHILTMMYNIFDINATEVKTNIQCK